LPDSYEVVRFGLRKVLGSHPKWEVVGEASDGKEAVAKALELKPDISVLDYACRW
jgi:DNA-binding NarL/FixJ family response regulator